jgi:hypothetical protein
MTGSSPRKTRTSSDTTNLDAKRISLGEDAGKIPECPLSYFLDSLLPSLPVDASPKIAKVKAKLNIDSDWAKKYGFVEPKTSTSNEDKTFQGLCTVFNELNKAYHDGQPENMVLEMVDTPNLAPYSEEGAQPAHNTRPDSCLKLLPDRSKSVTVPKKDRVTWSNIALTCEYEKRGSETHAKDVCYFVLKRLIFNERFIVLERPKDLVDYAPNLGFRPMPSFYFRNYG